LRRNIRVLAVIGTLGFLVVLLAKCTYFQRQEPSNKNAFAGSNTCVKCHKTITDSYLHNPHHETSHDITSDDVTPGFHAEGNSLLLNARLKIVVEKRNGRMYQVSYLDGKETICKPFDISIGSGKKAYTYGYWAGNQLKQLPLSFYSVINKWTNSPGFPTDLVYYERPIGSRCLECHSSFVDKHDVNTSGISVTEELKRSSLIYGIDCERCHGPAGKHVEFHLDSPQVKEPKYIVKYSTLTRAQKVDACAICHSGNDVEQKRSTFAFKPGEKLSDYYDAGSSVLIPHTNDVHGNHTQLMKKSACYITSNTMTCNSCHNTHEDQKVTLKIYSSRCMSCHQAPKHSNETLSKGILKDNCIDCHMPNEASKVISFQTAASGRKSAYMLRTHLIAIYPN
jgi:hypothetical protein